MLREQNENAFCCNLHLGSRDNMPNSNFTHDFFYTYTQQNKHKKMNCSNQTISKMFFFFLLSFSFNNSLPDDKQFRLRTINMFTVFVFSSLFPFSCCFFVTHQTDRYKMLLPNAAGSSCIATHGNCTENVQI